MDNLLLREEAPISRARRFVGEGMNAGVASVSLGTVAIAAKATRDMPAEWTIHENRLYG